MTPLAAALLAELDDEKLDRLAELLAPRIARLTPHGDATPYRNAQQAAQYLACPPSRIYDLVQVGKLPAHRDGRRLLFKVSDLDACLEASA